MRGSIFVARNEMERLIMEDALRKHRVRYEVWRTREYPEGRIFHYWCSPLKELVIKTDLFRKAFVIFRKERRKRRVAAL